MSSVIYLGLYGHLELDSAMLLISNCWPEETISLLSFDEDLYDCLEPSPTI